MPSGAKKRKAAKKKKEKENNINPQGNDELKSQDEKGSDGGEGSSPAYHDHDDHHHPFNEGSEEVEDGGSSAAHPSVSDAKSMEEVPGDINIEEVVGEKEDSVVMIERDLKSEESVDASFEHIETAKESYHGNGNTGGTSNDESLTEQNLRDENYNTIEGAVTSQELVKAIDSSPSKMALITENAPVEETSSSAAESSVNSVKAVTSVSEVENGDTTNNPAAESSVNSVKAVASVSEVENGDTTSNPAAESSVNSVKAVASVSEFENGDTGSVSLEKSVVPPLGKTDLVVKINQDNVYPSSDEKARTSSLEEPKPKEYDNKGLSSSSASPSTKFTNGAEHFKDSETPDCAENQPLVASAPHMVQKTSWLSCCGLFEVLGSNR